MAIPATRHPTILWLLFGFDGRIGRSAYWLGFGLMLCVEAIVMKTYLLEIAQNAATADEFMSELTSDPVFNALWAASVWSQFALAAKRLHDRGVTGFAAALLALPFVNLVAIFVIGLLPGERGANRFGPGPNSRAPLPPRI